jgi:hypothetical protein
MDKTDPTARAAWAKQLVDDSGGRVQSRDVLSDWDRDMFFNGKTVQLRLPLRDPAEVRRHLALTVDTLTALLKRLQDQPKGDRTDLLTVHGVIRALNQKLNAHRNPRR